MAAGPAAPAEILFNGRFLAARQTGVQRVAREMILALDRLLSGGATRITVFAPDRPLSPLPGDAIEVRKSGRFAGHPWEQFSLPAQAHGRTLINLCNTAPLAAPGIVMLHDAQVFLSPRSYSWQFRQVYRWLQPAIASRALRVLTVSEFSRDALVKFGVADRDRIHVIANGVDHMERAVPDAGILARLGLAGKRFAAGFGSRQRHKNAQILFRAFAEPALADITLVLAGGPHPREYAADGHKIPANVIFAGAVSDGELRALFEAAACMVCPSTTEGFGLPPLEAMLLGCPAVVAPCGALPEVCGGAVIYADPDDPAAWAKAIIEASERRAELANTSRAQARKYQWSASAAKLLDVICSSNE